jgi:S-adenosylmethionine:tRNA ribosyltransferase-isomerase
MSLPSDYDLQGYTFEVPPELIAQDPATERSGSRLMVLDRSSSVSLDARFREIDRFLPPGALLVFNESKVFPARLRGRKTDTGGRAEFLLLTPLPLLRPRSGPDGFLHAEAKGLVRPARRVRTGQTIRVSPELKLSVLAGPDKGRVSVRLSWQGDLPTLLQRCGEMPLPPYIKRAASADDRNRYQTVFAREDKQGSVAAPTAGLHFTREVLSRLAAKSIQWAAVTLYVGYGTFTPLQSRDVREHRMHAEYFEVPEETAAAVNRARREKRPLVAVGTTTVRTLESAARAGGWVEPQAGWTDLYIYPGFDFKVVNHLITNFHLPGSSLVLMTAAFAGRHRLLSAYRRAVSKRYRFFSYGDAMLIL